VVNKANNIMVISFGNIFEMFEWLQGFIFFVKKYP